MRFNLFKHLSMAAVFIFATVLSLSFSSHALAQEWGSGAQWNTEKAPLPEDQAFQIEAIKTEHGALVRMTPANGYYLYQDRSRFVVDQTSITGQWPRGELHDDPHFGPTLIHRAQIEVPLLFENGNQIRVEFQGCQDKGICYPPMQRTLTLGQIGESGTLLPVNEESAQPEAPSDVQARSDLGMAQDQAWVEKLSTKPLWWLLGAFFLGGLALSFTPCVLPMVPVVLGLIAPEVQNRKSFVLALAYVVSHAFVLALAGAIGAAIGGGAGISQLAQRPVILIGAAILFVALGAWQAGWIHFPANWGLGSTVHRFGSKLPKGRLWAAVGLGAGSALILGPCVAPLTAGALLFVAQSGSVWLGAGTLFMMGLGMGVPLLLMAAGAKRFVPKTGAWMTYLSRIGAMGLFAVAALLLDRASGQQSTLLWILSWAASSLILWMHHPKTKLLLTVLAAILATVAWMDARTIQIPQSSGLVFETVSAEELKARLGNGQAIILDLDADWCTECHTMQKTTFSSETVAEAAAPFEALRLNLDQIDAGERAFLKDHGLIGPPAVLFFDAQGSEIRDARLVGPEKANAFTQRLVRVSQL